MRARCPTARLVGRARLRGHTLAFGGYSLRWGGAVASVRRARGAIVEGLLHELDDEAVRRLDRFEGCPIAYERVLRYPVDDHGRRRRAQVYMQPEDGFEPWTPATEYLAVILRAYQRLGFDRAALANAAFGGTR